jgi:hypothetical protein
MAAPSTSSSARLVAASCHPQTGRRQHLTPFPRRAGGGIARRRLACMSRRRLRPPPRWAAGASRRDAASRLPGAIVLSPASSLARQHRHGGGRGLGGRENGAGQLGFHREAFLSLSRGMSSGRIIAGFRQSTDAAHAHPADRVEQTARGAPRSGRRVKPRCSTAFASGQVGKWAPTTATLAAQVDTCSPSDHWAPEHAAHLSWTYWLKFPVQKETHLALRKKNRARMDGQDAPWRRSDGPECLIAVEASWLCTNYTFRFLCQSS